MSSVEPQLLERLAMALRSVGRWEDALRTMNEALDHYEALGRAEDIGRLGWAMVYQLTWNGQLVEAVAVCRRAMAPLGDTASADKARLLSALGRALSASGDYAAAVATFDQARALAEQVGNERALADVLHMQTTHHLGYAEFADGIRVGLRAAETFEQESALWDLCSVQAFVIFEDGSLGSREQAISLADKTLGIAERLGHLGAGFLVLVDRIRQARDARRPAAGGGARSADRGQRRAGRTAVALLGPSLPGPGRALARQCRTRRGSSCEMPSSWSRRAHSPGKAPRCWRGTSPTTGVPTR